MQSFDVALARKDIDLGNISNRDDVHDVQRLPFLPSVSLLGRCTALRNFDVAERVSYNRYHRMLSTKLASSSTNLAGLRGVDRMRHRNDPLVNNYIKADMDSNHLIVAHVFSTCPKLQVRQPMTILDDGPGHH